MELGTYAVVVDPTLWNGTLDRLAAVLAPLMGTPAGRLAPLLRRGVVTVEAELGLGQAQRLAQRLRGLGVNAQIQGQHGITPPTSPEASQAPSGLPADLFEDFEELVAPFQLVVREEVPATISSTDWDAVLQGEGGGEGPAPTVPMRRDALEWSEVDSSLPEEKQEDLQASPSQDVGSWGELFPDLSEASSLVPEPEEPAPTATPVSTPPRGFGAEPLPEPVTQPAPGPAAGPHQARELGRALAAGLSDQRERPPYAPLGFDGAAPHAPEIAALLSAVAPGAGQIYNGQDEQAWRYGLRFFLVVPWIRSVRQAARRARRIATYWAPRPAPGVGRRVAMYVTLWYLAVLATAVGLVWTGQTMVARLRPPAVQPEASAQVVARAMLDAESKVLQGRIAALDALQRDLSERDRRPTFTMGEAERAERLFLKGLPHCRALAYRECAQVMRRVTQIQPTHRDAQRLQTWASAQLDPHIARQPMPQLQRTITDLEAYELRQQSDAAPRPPPQHEGE